MDVKISFFQRVTPRALILLGILTILSVIAVKASAINYTYNCDSRTCNTPMIKLSPKEVSQVRITCDDSSYPTIYRDRINSSADSPTATCETTDYSGTPIYLMICQNFDMNNSHQVSINWTCSAKHSGPF